MPTVGSITKTVRINPSDLEVIERLMSDGTSWSGAIHKLCEGGVPAESKYESMPEWKDLAGMVALSGGDMERMVKEVDRLMTEGTLTMENGVIKVGMPLWVERFEEACHDKCLEVERVAENAIKAVNRGTL